MGTQWGPIFTGEGLRTLAFVAAFCATSSVRAGPPADAGMSASGRSQRSGGAYVTGSLQPLGVMSSTHASTQAISNFIIVSPAPNSVTPTSSLPGGILPGSPSIDPFVSGPSVTIAPYLGSSQGSISSGSGTFVYTSAPGQTVTVIAQPNEPAITGNDLSPFLDVSRPDAFGIVIGRPAPPGSVGSTLDVSGASHYGATFAPRWILNRNSRYPVTVTLPAQVMLGEDPYWFGHSYGWISAGLNVRVPLSFIPSRYGKWSAGASADLCYYGTTMGEFAKSLGLQMPKLGAALSLEL